MSRILNSVFAGLIGATGLMACSADRPAAVETMVYVSNADSADISVLRLDNSTGSVTAVDRVAVGGKVMPLTVGPDRRFLYAALRSTPYSVVALAIDSKNGLANPTAPVALADNMAYLSTDRTGRFLFAASYTGDKISVNPIDATGHVVTDPIDVIATPPHAHSIITDPSNRYVFAATLGGDTILQFRFDPATGKLTPNQPAGVATRSGAGPRHLLFHPGGQFVYGTNELDGTVNTYRFDAGTGTLTLLDSTSVLPSDFSGPAPATSDLHITPDGRLLYVAERTSNTIAGFRIDEATGALRLLGHTPTETQPRGFGIDPRGEYLIAAGEKSNAITIYTIDHDTGALTPHQHIDVGGDPNWVEIVDLP
ncbi:beta-propeller fold lactonase family protein [Nocardia sp. NBC_00565]|uniref:lactonase family protein n=1 Tax=Nocardia sp. NBC_00565 TaxID=2975993 RepID=UPI002E81DF18|nr:beta-propeller fold lactonase family protein [Nocardia sp. NBC_00565]WUC05503.1 beta-propeller fold lactonase family protein [Nocardia sp. NBC_00565]